MDNLTSQINNNYSIRQHAIRSTHCAVAYVLSAMHILKALNRFYLGGVGTQCVPYILCIESHYK